MDYIGEGTGATLILGFIVWYIQSAIKKRNARILRTATDISALKTGHDLQDEKINELKRRLDRLEK